MDQTKILEGISMFTPPMLEEEKLCFWKQYFETYVKAKDLDLWDYIENGDFYEKEKISKDFEAKIILYITLARKEFERIFMCKTENDIWKNLVNIHQEHPQVIKDEQQYNEDENLDEIYVRSNHTCTSLKALGTTYLNKNYESKFLSAQHPRWRPKKDDEIVKIKMEETCLIALETNEVSFSLNCSYNSFDNLNLKYDVLCDLTLNIINENDVLINKIRNLENEALKVKNSNEIEIRDKNVLSKENDFLEETMKTFSTFNKSDDMLRTQKTSSDKSGLGVTNDSSKIKQVAFVKIKEVKENQGEVIIIQKSHVVSKIFKIKHEKGYNINDYKMQSKRSYNSYPTRNNNYFYNYNKRHFDYQQNNPRLNYFGKEKHISYNNMLYNPTIKVVLKWVKVGIFDTNNPGPMKYWVPRESC